MASGVKAALGPGLPGPHAVPLASSCAADGGPSSVWAIAANASSARTAIGPVSSAADPKPPALLGTGTEIVGPCLCVSASQRENLLHPMSRIVRCQWNEPRSVSERMRMIRPQRRRVLTDVSASQRENLLQLVSRSGQCRWSEPRNVSKRMRMSRPLRRRDAEFLLMSPRLRVSAGEPPPSDVTQRAMPLE